MVVINNGPPVCNTGSYPQQQQHQQRGRQIHHSPSLQVSLCGPPPTTTTGLQCSGVTVPGPTAIHPTLLCLMCSRPLTIHSQQQQAHQNQQRSNGNSPGNSIAFVACLPCGRWFEYYHPSQQLPALCSRNSWQSPSQQAQNTVGSVAVAAAVAAATGNANNTIAPALFWNGQLLLRWSIFYL